MSVTPRISIVVVTYKSRGFIDRCLAPFDNRPDIEILVLENASGDGITDHIRTRFPRVRLIDSTENLGFARGNNRAFTYCTGRYVLLLNPDAFVNDAACVDALADYLDAHSDVGAAGPRLINADGSHQVGDAGWRISLATVTAHAFMAQRLFATMPSLYLTNNRLLARPVIDVDWVCGACMMVRAEVIAKVGGMDEKVFMYGEDIEWGTRIRDAGLRIAYLPGLAVLHLQGATQKGNGDLFVSTKWLDDIAQRYVATGNRAGYLALRGALLAGYGIRAALFSVAGTIARRKAWVQRGRAMAVYARHAIALPSFTRVKN
jgi:N-acetylglucosaminyl-diphospho-decaprenol L-rhamnosyltransferase